MSQPPEARPEMDQSAVVKHVYESFDDVQVQNLDGNLFFFYGAERMFPFATLMTNDINDQDSDLNRPDVFRLNVGVSRRTFESLFGSEEKEWDFTQLDCLMPHPVYSRNQWVCALNPGAQTWEALQTLLQEAHAAAVNQQIRREQLSSRRNSDEVR